MKIIVGTKTTTLVKLPIEKGCVQPLFGGVTGTAEGLAGFLNMCFYFKF